MEAMSNSAFFSSSPSSSSTSSPVPYQYMEDSYPWLTAINKFNSTYSIPIIVLVGTVTNLLVFAVFLFSPLRRLATSVYLAAISLTDVAYLVFLGMGWMDEIGVPIFDESKKYTMMVFGTYMASFLSIWFVVAFTAKLYTSMYWPRLHRLLNRPKRALQLSTILLMATVCSIYLFSIHNVKKVKIDGTADIYVFNGGLSTVVAASIADTLLTMIIPFSLLAFMNIRIILTLTKLYNNQNKDQRVRSQSPCKQSSHPTIASTSGSPAIARIEKMAVRMKRTTHQCPHVTKSRRENTSKLSSCTLPKNKMNNDSFSFKIDLCEICDPRQTMNTQNKSDVKEVIQYTNSANAFSMPRLRVEREELRITRSNEESPDLKRNTDRIETINIELQKGNFQTKKNVVIRTARKYQMAKRQNYSKNNGTLSNKLHTGGLWHHSLYNKRDSSISFSKSHSTELILKNGLTRNRIDQEREQQDTMKRFLRSRSKLDNVTIKHNSTKLSQTRNDIDKNQNEHPVLNNNVSATFSGRSTATLPISHLRRKFIKITMINSVLLLALNIPRYLIRLLIIGQSILSPTHPTNELTSHLYQLFLTIYYLNFVINIVTYSFCYSRFQKACVNLPRHISETLSCVCQRIYGCCHCGYFDLVEHPILTFSKRRNAYSRDMKGHCNSRMVHISELDFSRIRTFAPDFKYVSPPCLLRLESSSLTCTDHGKKANNGSCVDDVSDVSLR